MTEKNTRAPHFKTVSLPHIPRFITVLARSDPVSLGSEFYTSKHQIKSFPL